MHGDGFRVVEAVAVPRGDTSWTTGLAGSDGPPATAGVEGGNVKYECISWIGGNHPLRPQKAMISGPNCYNSAMRMISLQSGSNGNAVLVEAAGMRLLVDAGISGVQMERRLADHGLVPADIDALLISHDHSDHVRAMGVYQRKYSLPVYVTERTLMAAHRRVRLGMLDDLRLFRSGATFRIGEAEIETLRTPHDSADGVGFVISDGDRRLGVLTDLGHPFAALRDVLRTLDAVLLESNYDPHLLATGPYPEFLKQRIRGLGGHLSNPEAADLLSEAFRHQRLQWACLGHLSEHNNEPSVALRTHRAEVGSQVPIHIASRHESSTAYPVLSRPQRVAATTASVAGSVRAAAEIGGA